MRGPIPHKPGDRVISNGLHQTLEYGVTGTVLDPVFNKYSVNVSVAWDDGRKDQGWHYSHMELAKDGHGLLVEDTREYLEAVTKS